MNNPTPITPVEKVCILEGLWIDADTGQSERGPKYNEVVTVIGEDDSHYQLAEYNPEHGYLKICFVDVLPTSAISELIEETSLELVK